MRDDRSGDRPEPSAPEPRQEDLGRRSFAGENVAADQRRQAKERNPSLDTDARSDETGDSTGVEHDGNGDPLGGMTPEDDVD